MDELLESFKIGRSLSMKGCPYDTAVAEATYKVMKTEFIHQMSFQSLRHWELELFDYVDWFNKHRIHETLGYMIALQPLKKLSELLLTIQFTSHQELKLHFLLSIFPLQICLVLCHSK
ncbi:IS3 family transposase [Paenibacillus sp. GCM10012306]|uniref:IS3 family transposase n=1 Tax=Paenibacillus sp. GCM10012306 TaxID=3317342 RepID=UPI0036090EAD